MKLTEICKVALIDNHYTEALELVKAFGGKQEVYFTHCGSFRTGTIRSINYNNKTLRYWIVHDGCICPATFFQTKPRIFRDIIYTAKELTESLITSYCPLHYDGKHGYYVDSLTVDTVENVLQDWDPYSTLTTYNEIPYKYRPLEKLRKMEWMENLISQIKVEIR